MADARALTRDLTKILPPLPAAGAGFVDNEISYLTKSTLGTLFRRKPIPVSMAWPVGVEHTFPPMTVQYGPRLILCELMFGRRFKAWGSLQWEMGRP